MKSVIFNSPLERHQKGLEESVEGNEFGFDELLHYKCYKIRLIRSGSYTDFPKWLKNKKAIVNSNI